MFCQKCGTQNEDTGNFCTKCSSPLHTGSLNDQQPTNQSRPAKKKNPFATILIVLACLIIAFFIWAMVSPDDTTVDSDPKTGDSTEASSKAASNSDTNNAPSSESNSDASSEIVIANTPEEAVNLVRQLKHDDGYEYEREENFIENVDGSLSIDVNTPENANVACFVIAPPEGSVAGNYGYEGYYMVQKGTNRIFYPDPDGSGILIEVPIVTKFLN